MRETHRYWPLTTACGRFEHVVAFKLSLITAMLIALESKHFATSTWPLLLAALAFATLVLGAVYWLLRERDDRVTTIEPALMNLNQAA